MYIGCFKGERWSTHLFSLWFHRGLEKRQVSIDSGWKHVSYRREENRVIRTALLCLFDHEPCLCFIETLIDDGHDLLQHSVHIMKRFRFAYTRIVEIVFHIRWREWQGWWLRWRSQCHHGSVMRRWQRRSTLTVAWILTIHNLDINELNTCSNSSKATQHFPSDLLTY